MANGRLYSAYRGAGKAKSSYKASLSDIYNVGLEAQHSQSMADIEGKRREDAIGMISEGLTLTSNLYEGHKSKQEMSKISKDMGAEVQKQSGLDWLFGAEKEYKLEGKTYTASELKAKYKSDDYKLPTLAEEADMSLEESYHEKIKKGIQPSIEEAIAISKNRKPKKRMMIGKHKGLDILGGKDFIGEEKGIDTKTKDWFSNLFKGGADVQSTDGVNSKSLNQSVDVPNRPTSFNPKPLNKLTAEELSEWSSLHGDPSSTKKIQTQYANWQKKQNTIEEIGGGGFGAFSSLGGN
tara:strand:+ start:79 stop:960 length:882 start_codon:yes stop_codon:yes gene_type:complete